MAFEIAQELVVMRGEVSDRIIALRRGVDNGL